MKVRYYISIVCLHSAIASIFGTKSESIFEFQPGYYCSWGYIDEEHGTVHCSPAWRTLLLYRTILESSRCRTDDRAVSIRSSHFFDRDERMKNAQLAVRCANDVNSQSWSTQSVISNCLKSVRFQYSSDGSKWAEFRPHERVDAWTVLWEKHELSNSGSEMTITTLNDDELTVPVVLRIKNAVFPNICSGFLIWDERWDHYVNHYWTFGGTPGNWNRSGIDRKKRGSSELHPWIIENPPSSWESVPDLEFFLIAELQYWICEIIASLSIYPHEP